MNPVHRLIGPAEAPHASTLRRNGAPPRRERTACRCLAVAIARSKDPSACISEETFSKAEPHGIMLRRDDAPLKAIADRASADLYRSPEIEAIYRKWFESPVPPNRLNFNTPMSSVLRNPFADLSDSPEPASYER
jgi:glutamate/aspartate transport system substrate-binding protein